MIPTLGGRSPGRVGSRLALDSDGSASSSSESVASTEELSFVEASPETASSQVRGVSGEGETVERGQAPGAVQYRAVGEGLVVRCVDGQAVIPLPGWSLAEIQAIVFGMNTGDWKQFESMLQRRPLIPFSSALEGSSEVASGSGDPIQVRGDRWGFVTVYSGSWVGLVLWVVVFSFLVQGAFGKGCD